MVERRNKQTILSSGRRFEDPNKIDVFELLMGLFVGGVLSVILEVANGFGYFT